MWESLPSACTVLLPVMTQPLDLAVLHVGTQPLIMEPRVLRIAFERVGDVDTQTLRIDCQPTIVEEAVNVAAQ